MSLNQQLREPRVLAFLTPRLFALMALSLPRCWSLAASPRRRPVRLRPPPAPPTARCRTTAPTI